ncbi:MAG TPA: hypothetical protein VM901_00035 [Bdellovibrionota bacterium]|nr:hypothetical protein [Bdellovibrionota bacterium]
MKRVLTLATLAVLTTLSACGGLPEGVAAGGYCTEQLVKDHNILMDTQNEYARTGATIGELQELRGGWLAFQESYPGVKCFAREKNGNKHKDIELDVNALVERQTQRLENALALRKIRSAQE